MNAIQQLNDTIKREASVFLEIAKETNRVVVGQDRLINRLLRALWRSHSYRRCPRFGKDPCRPDPCQHRTG